MYISTVVYFITDQRKFAIKLGENDHHSLVVKQLLREQHTQKSFIYELFYAM